MFWHKSVNSHFNHDYSMNNFKRHTSVFNNFGTQIFDNLRVYTKFVRESYSENWMTCLSVEVYSRLG